MFEKGDYLECSQPRCAELGLGMLHRWNMTTMAVPRTSRSTATTSRALQNGRTLVVNRGVKQALHRWEPVGDPQTPEGSYEEAEFGSAQASFYLRTHEKQCFFETTLNYSYPIVIQ